MGGGAMALQRHETRVKIGVGKDFVVVVSVSSGHPKENE
jgi:hypothetical protein